MLKLKKIQILGFKSFADKTEVALPGHGIAVVVGPNGCGKSNILDGITWVLGEQSAKTLRGGKMEDVIFAGTRDRRALGMAEVSITLMDPDVAEPRNEDLGAASEARFPDGDWDEPALRAASAREAEQIVAASQPGFAPAERDEGQADGAAESEAEAAGESEVVLRIRRRRFARVARQGEVVVARRLFRTGDSEYLLNGKLCRLADIRDIFIGTGLGPESYAIIGQERIGQLLSSKPHDRRAIIEEAAGITRFKTRKRLAELRLEQARQNLARIDDIFEEVARQLVSLRRQASKAERYAVLREEFRARLRAVLASRLADTEEQSALLAEEIKALSVEIDARAGEIDGLQAEAAAGQAHGYALDAAAREQARLARESAVELERARSRRAGNAERVRELDARAETGTAELREARGQLATLGAEREEGRSFLASAAGQAMAMRTEAARRQATARESIAAVGQAESRVEATRRDLTQLLHRLGQVRREHAQAEEGFASADRDAQRLNVELQAAHRDLESLGLQRGQVSLRFESASEALQRLEAELAGLRAEAQRRRNEEMEVRRRGDSLRAERATLAGRRDALEALLREHSYSTDTVKKLLRAQTLAGNLKPVGTLADFLEVGEQYESVVDEFLREELNFIVVTSWDAADEGMRLLKGGPGGGVDGRATFLVHPDDAQARFSFAVDENAGLKPQQGVVGLKHCVRVLDGFGKSLEVILPKLRDGYVVADAEVGRALALENPDAFFLAPSGECFHNVTVTGGKPRAEGPLALKRELREAGTRLAGVEAELAAAELQAAVSVRTLAELTRAIDDRAEQRRSAERESAHEAAALRQMEGEKQRLERRLAEWTLESERARTRHREKAELIARKAEEAEQLEQAHAALEAKTAGLQEEVAAARSARDLAQAEAAAVAAELAGLEERRRGAEASFTRMDRAFADHEHRAAGLEAQLAVAAEERAKRAGENTLLARREEELQATSAAAESEVQTLSEKAATLRARLGDLEAELKQRRVRLEAARETRAVRETASARLAVELRHLTVSCVEELGVEADALRAAVVHAPEGEAAEQAVPDAAQIHRLSPQQLAEEEASCREMKRRLEAMGPVNMMALEEFRETEERHGFLETQRRDLLESIENTRSTIREIDGVSRAKFDEAFARINENFGRVFERLFGGGQASMQLTDQEHASDSGIDIVAQPPGKKLQNVFLLSGGEKALTALSLLMGIFMYQPAPFCVLDEVDAPLDEANVGRLAEMLQSMAAETQFMMVTHSKRMMSAADLIYGVTMQEPGVSKLVSVRLGQQAPGHAGEGSGRPLQRRSKTEKAADAVVELHR